MTLMASVTFNPQAPRRVTPEERPPLPRAHRRDTGLTQMYCAKFSKSCAISYRTFDAGVGTEFYCITFNFTAIKLPNCLQENKPHRLPKSTAIPFFFLILFHFHRRYIGVNPVDIASAGLDPLMPLPSSSPSTTPAYVQLQYLSQQGI